MAYTDGMIEPENEYGEMFGEQRLTDLLARNVDREASGDDRARHGGRRPVERRFR